MFWGTSATLARFVFRDRHAPPLTVVELRLGFAAIMLGAWLVWRHPERLRIAGSDWGYVAILAVFGLAAVQGSYYYSISVLGVGLSILIQYLAPSLLVMIDLFRGRRVRRRVLIAVAAALAGTALLVGNVDPRAVRATPLQWMVSFSAALSFAFYIGFSKRGLSKYPSETVLFYTLSMASLVWAGVTPPWKIVSAGYDAQLWILFFALSVFSTLVPFAMFNAGLKHLSATETGVLSTLEPVIAVLSAAVFLGEWLRPLQGLGALLVLCAAVLSSGAGASRNPEP